MVTINKIRKLDTKYYKMKVFITGGAGFIGSNVILNKYVSTSCKVLNYDRARALALQGDSVGAAKDLVDQIGGAAEFNKMNVVQQRALAQSVGLSVGEMKKALGVKDKEAELAAEQEEARHQAQLDSAEGIKMMATTMETFKQMLHDVGKILAEILGPEAKKFMDYIKDPQGQARIREIFVAIKDTAIVIKDWLIQAWKDFFGYTDE